MKNLIILFFTSFVCLLTGCNEVSITPLSDASTSTRSRNDNSCQVNYPTGWESLTDHHKKTEALQLDEDALQSLTTKELVEWCAEYPLAFDCFAFNDINIGINTVMDRFNGFTELHSRSDNFEALRNYYIAYIDKLERTSLSHPSEISPLHCAYIEYILSSERFGKLSNHLSDNELIYAFIKSAELKKKVPELQGEICKSALQSLSAKLPEIAELNLSMQKSIGKLKSYTIYTNNGLPVIAYNITCNGDQKEVKEGEEYQRRYANAIYLAAATCTYNCHAYAWYISEGGENCWIDATSEGSKTVNDNIRKFWVDGTYVQCDSTEAEKVFYSKGDHSAVVVSPGVYVSKWGVLPLFQHAPNECPYNYTDKVFYKKYVRVDPGPSSTTYYGYLNCDQSTDPTPLWSTILFNANHDYLIYYRYTAFVARLKSPETPIEDPNVAEILSVSHQNVSVRFNKQGSYVVNYCVYHSASGHLDAVYQSQEIYVNPERKNDEPEEEI